MLGIFRNGGARVANLVRHSSLFGHHAMWMAGAPSAALTSRSDIFGLSSLPDASQPLAPIFKGQPEMPVTDRVTRAIMALPDRPDFSNMRFVLLQHGMETMLPEVAALRHLGALENRIYILPKLYSRHSGTMDALRAGGIYVHPNQNPGTYGAIDAAYDHDVKSFWDHIRRCADADPDEGIVLLADGFQYHHRPFGISHTDIFGAEQTSRGLQPGQQLGSPLSFLDIAGCCFKRDFESRIIADAVVRSVLEHPKLAEKLRPGSTHGVAGRGVIGRILGQKLAERGCIVYVYDKDSTKMPTTTNGIRPAMDMGELWARIDSLDGILFGATGEKIIGERRTKDTISPADLHKTQHVTCVSVSSGDVEFHPGLREHAEKVNGAASVLPAETFLEDVTMPTAVDGTVTFIRGGVPINFNQGPYSVVPRLIDPIRALMGPIAATLAVTMLNRSRSGAVLGSSGKRHFKVPASLQELVIHAAAEHNEEYAAILAEKPGEYTVAGIDGRSSGDYLPGDSCAPPPLLRAASRPEASPLTHATRSTVPGVTSLLAPASGEADDSTDRGHSARCSSGVATLGL